MRTFIILRGPQASGRTRFICESGMSPWHVDQRAIEALTCEPVIDRNGAMVFDRKSRGRARERVLDALREKFMRGSLVLFEPTDTGSPVGRATVALFLAFIAIGTALALLLALTGLTAQGGLTNV